MLSIQDVGKQILLGSPLKFYVMVGLEYGIKERYLQILKDHYGGRLTEAISVIDLLNMMKTKHIIPLQPTLYVVRYDDAFISSINQSTQSLIASTNIIGTIVCIYEQSKHSAKCIKYLPDYTVSIDAINSQFVRKYLHSDFPTLPDRFINLAESISSNYGHAKNICRSMSAISVDLLYSESDMEISKLFGYADTSSDSALRKGIAARNFKYLLDVIDKYPDDSDNVLYAILSTMIELDKILDNKYAQSDIRKYASRWTRPDIYYMFMNTYRELERSRSMSNYNTYNGVIYLIALLAFPNIPAPEVMI